jgi:NTE family protein
MSNKDSTGKVKIGLALSGGGYRASAYHLGTLNKLHELRILDQISVISCISGGAITGAYYGLSEGPYENFREAFAKKISSKNLLLHMVFSVRFLLGIVIGLVMIILPVKLAHYGLPWLAALSLLLELAILRRYQFTLMPLSRIGEEAYGRCYFGKKKLSDLRKSPAIAMNATNLDTGRQFTFSREKMSDSKYEYRTDGRAVRFIPTNFPIKRAVMASTCVPQFFPPISIGRKYYATPADAAICRPTLIDGGIYDNQGIHKLTQAGSSYECHTIIVSDAGNKFPAVSGCHNTIGVLAKTVDGFMARVKHSQMVQHIYDNVRYGVNREIAYTSLGWDIRYCIDGFMKNLAEGNCPPSVIKAHRIPEEWMNNIPVFKTEIKDLVSRNVRLDKIIAQDLEAKALDRIWHTWTSLWPLRAITIANLVRHAENMTEVQVRLYCPSLFLQPDKNE